MCGRRGGTSDSGSGDISSRETAAPSPFSPHPRVRWRSSGTVTVPRSEAEDGSPHACRSCAFHCSSIRRFLRAVFWKKKRIKRQKRHRLNFFICCVVAALLHARPHPAFFFFFSPISILEPVTRHSCEHKPVISNQLNSRGLRAHLINVSFVCLSGTSGFIQANERLFGEFTIVM